ncbi:MAG: OmpH family outer membrane protein [Prevotella sp.]|nr:OmpH family outer membrane protein [Prevotella sp.]
MNKKNLFRTMAVAIVATFALSSCNDSNKMDDKPEKVAAQTAAPGSLRIAYIEVDSIMSQYEFCKEYSKILEKRSNNIQNELAGQEKNLAAAAQNFQNKLQNNGFTSEQEAKNQQAALQRQNENLEATRVKLSQSFQEETDKFNKALHDSLQHYLDLYNKDKKFSMILAKSGDNILYADKALDVTAEVVAGLNKAYKSKPSEKTEAKTEEKKK